MVSVVVVAIEESDEVRTMEVDESEPKEVDGRIPETEKGKV